MRLIFGKKGLSPVIATVLLIALALVLAAIIFLWMKGFISEQLEKQGKPIEQICAEVSFEPSYKYNPISNSFSLQIVNRGNVNLYGFNVKFLGGGSSSMKSFPLNVDIGETSDTQIVPVIEEGSDEVVLYPMVLSSVKGKTATKPVTCLESGKTISLA